MEKIRVITIRFDETYMRDRTVIDDLEEMVADFLDENMISGYGIINYVEITDDEEGNQR